MKRIECPVCGSNEFLPKRNKPDYQVGICSDCSLAYMHPYFKGVKNDVGDSNSSITAADYYSNILKEHETQSELAKKKAPKMLEYWSQLHNKKITSILEVGCGTGQYFEAWRELDIQWTGLEVNNEMIDFCHKKNIPVKRFSEHVDSNNKYDVIFLSQVLEHILEPHQFLLQLRNFMDEHTVLHIDVPNHDSITSMYRRVNIFHKDYGFVQPYHHQIAYTKKAMTLLMKNNNFQIIDIATYTNDHSVFGQLLISKSVVSKLLYFLSHLTNRGSLLICVATK